MKDNIIIRNPKLSVSVIYAICCVISYFTGIGCVWKYIFGIPCPGCGFTHAVVYAAHLNFAEAFDCHPMFWSFPIIMLYFIIGDKIKTKVFDLIMLAIVLGFIAVWVYRLII